VVAGGHADDDGRVQLRCNVQAGPGNYLNLTCCVRECAVVLMVACRRGLLQGVRSLYQAQAALQHR